VYFNEPRPSLAAKRGRISVVVETSAMADLVGEPPKPPPLQTRTAVTRKHLRRDQAVTRKGKGKVVATDTIKERQVGTIL
jgi:hypothetical protein